MQHCMHEILFVGQSQRTFHYKCNAKYRAREFKTTRGTEYSSCTPVTKCATETHFSVFQLKNILIISAILRITFYSLSRSSVSLICNSIKPCMTRSPQSLFL